jgi:hypothetical protein
VGEDLVRVHDADDAVQPDPLAQSIGVFLFALVLVSKDSFEPMCLFVCEPFIHGRKIVTYDELLAATFTPERSRFLQTGCLLSALPLLYGRCPHLLNFSGIR